MVIDKDYKKLLVLLKKHQVEYMVVGAYAVAFHGYPRYTGDIDFWVNPTKENGDKLVQTLH